MDLPIAQEPRVLKAGNQPQHARLVAIFQVILEADQVVGVGAQVFLAQLHHRIRPFAGTRIVKPHGLHGAKTQGVTPAPPNLFDRQTAFKVVQLLPVMAFHRLGGNQRVIKTVILLFGEGAIDVVRGALAIARRHVDLAHVDGVGFDDRADGVIEEQVIAAGEAANLARERV